MSKREIGALVQRVRSVIIQDSGVPEQGSRRIAQILSDWYGIEVREPSAARMRYRSVPQVLIDWHQAVRTSLGGLSWMMVSQPVEPDELRADENGIATFWRERHGCWEWGFPVGDDDPVVYESEPGAEFESWLATGNVLSEFLLWATVVEIGSGGPFRAVAKRLSREQVQSLVSPLQPLEVSYGGRFMAGVDFFFGSGLIVHIEEPVRGAIVQERGEEGVLRAWLAARGSSELNSFLQAHDDIAWNIRGVKGDRAGEEPPF